MKRAREFFFPFYSQVHSSWATVFWSNWHELMLSLLTITLVRVFDYPPMHFVATHPHKGYTVGKKRASRMSFWWRLHPAALRESHFSSRPPEIWKTLTVFLFVQPLGLFPASLTCFMCKGRHIFARVRLAPLSAEEQLNIQVLLDFLAENVPEACREASLWQLESLFLFFHSLAAVREVWHGDLTQRIYIESSVDQLFIYLH